jgi:hypothetical protein
VDVLLVLREPPQRCGWGLCEQCGTLSFRVGKALSLYLRPQSFTVPLLPIPSGHEPMGYSLAAAYMERTQPIPSGHLRGAPAWHAPNGRAELAPSHDMLRKACLDGSMNSAASALLGRHTESPVDP